MSGELFDVVCQVARKEREPLEEALEALVVAMEQSVEVGCTDHLDCWEEAEELWWGPLVRARKLLELK